ncbi:MAG: hypothetical protein ACFFKA_21585 [Candidatus Thorarchaeota archaeon]
MVDNSGSNVSWQLTLPIIKVYSSKTRQQRRIYNNDYICGLYARDEISSIRLSNIGEQIYTAWYAQWNRINRDEVWHFEDCWPIYLLDDARELIDFFREAFLISSVEGLGR